MLSVGFIGIGQVGGEVADMAAKCFGYPALAVNTASVDLVQCEHIDETYRFHCSGFEGAGKNRGIGESAYEAHKESLLERIAGCFKKTHVLFPVFSLGGGTGSGMGPSLLRDLVESFPNQLICPIVYLPHRNENVRSRTNALEAFSEINQTEGLGALFLFDNDRIRSSHPLVSEHTLFTQTKEKFLRTLTHFLTCTTKHSQHSVLDSMDLLSCLSQPGVSYLSEIAIIGDSLTNETLSESIKLAFEQSVFSVSDASLAVSVSTTLSYDEDIHQHTSLDDIFSSVCSPLELFKGIYQEKKNAPAFHVLCTGIPFPSLSLQTLEQDATKDCETIQKQLETTESSRFEVKTSFTKSLPKTKRFQF